MEQQFDELGRDGWELSWILMNQALHGEKDGHVVIFKRPLENGDVQKPSPSNVDVFTRPPSGGGMSNQ